jgi:hypothetical protein
VTASNVLVSLALLWIWVGGLCQLVGIPVAWLRLQGTGAWAERPREVRRMTLLAEYMRPVTEIAIAGAYVVALLVLLLALAFRPGENDALGIAIFAFLYGAPVALTPWAVARLDPARLARLELYRRAARSG